MSLKSTPIGVFGERFFFSDAEFANMVMPKDKKCNQYRNKLWKPCISGTPYAIKEFLEMLLHLQVVQFPGV